MLQYQFVKIHCYQTNNIAIVDDKVFIWGSFPGLHRIITPNVRFSSILDVIGYASDDIYHWHNKSKIQLAYHTETILDHTTKPTHKVHFLLQYNTLYVNDKSTQVSYFAKYLWRWELRFVIHLNETILKIKRNSITVFILTQSGILCSSGTVCPNCLTPNKCFDDVRILSRNVMKFTCSKGRIVILTSDNKIYSSNITQCRQLCSRCEYNNIPFWTEHILPEGIIPKKISCGEYYTIIMTTCNTLYAFGDNCYGQLGLGDYKYKHTFQQVPFIFPRIKSIQCGAYHTIVVTVCNEIYVWGRNYQGQLGLGDELNRTVPTRLNFEF